MYAKIGHNMEEEINNTFFFRLFSLSIEQRGSKMLKLNLPAKNVGLSYSSSDPYILYI